MEVYDRNLIWKKHIDNEILSKREIKKHEEMKECVFRPSIETYTP